MSRRRLTDSERLARGLARAWRVRCALDGVTAQRDGRRLLLWPAERTF